MNWRKWVRIALNILSAVRPGVGLAANAVVKAADEAGFDEAIDKAVKKSKEKK